MKPTDLHTGGARLRKSLEELMRHWEDAGDQWNDGVSRAFYEQRLEPVVPVIKNTLDAVGRMQTLLDQAQRDMEG